MAKTSNPGGKKVAQVGTLTVIAIIAVILISLMVLSWRNVRPGYVGIVFDKATHKVTAAALEPGWAFINPFTQAIQEYPVTIQTYAMVQRTGEGSEADDDSIKVQSNEGQQLNLDVFVQYRVKREEAAALYQDWGGADISVIEDRVVRQYARTYVRDVTSQYGWEEIVSGKRNEITDEINLSMAEELGQRHLELVSFGIRGTHLPQRLQQALDDKIEAQQKAEQQRYQLEQAKIKADQDRVEAEGQAAASKARAEGEAEAIKALAAGEAESIRIRANAQAEANEILAKSLTSELIRYQQVDRWDGKLPIFNGGDTTPLIDATSIISNNGE